MLVSEMIDKAAKTFQDEAKVLVTSSEWLDYVREWLLDYSSRTEQFRTRQRLQTGQNPWCYQMPEGAISLLWCSYEDKSLPITSYKELESVDAQFASRTGTPQMAYLDMSSTGEMRLYPAPVYEDPEVTQFQGVPTTWDGTDLAADLVDQDFGDLHKISDSENTYRFVRAMPAGGVVPLDEADETGHPVAFFRTDSPMSQPGVAGNQAQLGGAYQPGKVCQILTSGVEIAFSYTPNLPDEEKLALGTEIPLQDRNEMAGYYFLLQRAYAKSIETNDAQKADYYRQLYEQRVDIGIRKKSDSWASRRRRTKGRYI